MELVGYIAHINLLASLAYNLSGSQMSLTENPPAEHQRMECSTSSGISASYIQL